MMKRIVYSLAIAATLLCAASACNSNKNNDNTETNSGSYTDNSSGDTSGSNMLRDTLRR